MLMTLRVLGKDRSKESNQRVDLTREGAQSVVPDVYFPRRSHVTLDKLNGISRKIESSFDNFRGCLCEIF